MDLTISYLPPFIYNYVSVIFRENNNSTDCLKKDVKIKILN